MGNDQPGNTYRGLQHLLGLYRGYIGIMEKKMETTIMVYIRIIGFVFRAVPGYCLRVACMKVLLDLRQCPKDPMERVTGPIGLRL